jgi:hypothetical protein
MSLYMEYNPQLARDAEPDFLDELYARYMPPASPSKLPELFGAVSGYLGSLSNPFGGVGRWPFVVLLLGLSFASFFMLG